MSLIYPAPTQEPITSPIWMRWFTQLSIALNAVQEGGVPTVLPYAGVGVPQLKLQGSLLTRYATFRDSGDGGDDGDLIFQQTGDSIWMQSYTSGYRQTLGLVPNNNSVASAPANLELYGTNWLADGLTHYERLRIHSCGTSENEHEIISEAGGTGTVRPIHMFISGVANGLYIGTTGNNGFGSLTPRRKLDILDANAQLRLSYSDNATYAEFKVASDGTLNIIPVSNASVDYNSVGRLKTENGGMGILFLSESSSDQSAPASGQATIYTKDNGSGKAQLCVRFNSGAVQILATQP